MDEPTNQPMQVQSVKPKPSYKPWALVFGVLFLAAAGYAGWQAMQMDQANAKVTTLESTTAQLQADNTSLQGQLGKLQGVETSDTQTDPDKAKVLAATDAHARAPVAATGEFKYDIKEMVDKFARVAVATPEGGGYQVFLKKVGDNWTVLLASQEDPGQQTIDQYGIPKSILN